MPVRCCGTAANHYTRCCGYRCHSLAGVGPAYGHWLPWLGWDTNFMCPTPHQMYSPSPSTMPFLLGSERTRPRLWPGTQRTNVLVGMCFMHGRMYTYVTTLCTMTETNLGCSHRSNHVPPRRRRPRRWLTYRGFEIPHAKSNILAAEEKEGEIFVLGAVTRNAVRKFNGKKLKLVAGVTAFKVSLCVCCMYVSVLVVSRVCMYVCVYVSGG